MAGESLDNVTFRGEIGLVGDFAVVMVALAVSCRVDNKHVDSSVSDGSNGLVSLTNLNGGCAFPKRRSSVAMSWYEVHQRIVAPTHPHTISADHETREKNHAS